MLGQTAGRRTEERWGPGCRNDRRLCTELEQAVALLLGIARTSVESALEVTQVRLPEYPIVSKPHPSDLNRGDVALQRVLEAVLEGYEVGYLPKMYAKGRASG